VSNAIVIAANGVTLDLNGFTISSTVANAANGGTAISLGDGLRDITIANGHIQGGVTNNGSGVYSGSGFGYGIYYYYSGVDPVNVRVSGVSVSGVLHDGINVAYGNNSTTVECCTVNVAGGRGIIAAVIRGSTAVFIGLDGILGRSVSDCSGNSVVSGDGVFAETAQNCFGISFSGHGVAGGVVLNCSGYSNNTGDGVRAYRIAQNCNGSCLSFSRFGVRVDEIAIGCYGYNFSSSGTGLYAYIANSCMGDNGSGHSITYGYAYNQPY
jgi:hypothetical protein